MTNLTSEEILDLYNDPMVGHDFFEIIEANGVSPSDIEFLGDDIVHEYGQWIYGHIK